MCAPYTVCVLAGGCLDTHQVGLAFARLMICMRAWHGLRAREERCASAAKTICVRARQGLRRFACARGVTCVGVGERCKCARGQCSSARATVNMRAWDDVSLHEGRFTCAPRTVCVRVRKEYLLEGTLTRVMNSRFILSTGEAVASTSQTKTCLSNVDEPY